MFKEKPGMRGEGGNELLQVAKEVREGRKWGDGVMGPFPDQLEASKQLLAGVLAAKQSQILPGWGGQVASHPKTI